MTSSAQSAPQQDKHFLPALVTALAAAIWSLTPGFSARVILASPLILLPALWWILRRSDRWVLIFLVAVLCLPPLPIPMGDSGPHPALSIAAVGLIAGALRFHRWQARLPAASTWLLAYPLVLLASVSLAAVYSGPGIATASLARVLLFSISIYLFLYTASGSESSQAETWRDLRILFGAGVISAAFACFDFYFQFPAPAGFGAQFVWLESGVYRRAQGFFYEASTLGNVCAFFLVMAAVCLMRPTGETPFRRVVLVPASAVLFAALLLSFSRASVVNLGVAVLMLLILHRRQLPLARVSAAVCLASIIGIAATYAFVPAVVEFYWLRLSSSAGLLLRGNEAALSGRLDNWRLLIQFLLEHPEHAIFGVGYKTLPYSSFTGQPTVADNAYLSALIETGIVGLIVLMLFHAAILTMAWRAARSADKTAQFFGTWIACFWAGEMVQMLSGDLLTYWRALPAYFWVLAIAVRSSRPALPR